MEISLGPRAELGLGIIQDEEEKKEKLNTCLVYGKILRESTLPVVVRSEDGLREV